MTRTSHMSRAWLAACDQSMNPRTWLEVLIIVITMLATVTVLSAIGVC